MAHILEEWKKVAALTADREEVTREDIQAICTLNVEENIFALTDQIANKKAAGAMKVFSDLVSRNTAPQKIFYMIIRQFRQLLRAAILSEEGKNTYEVAKVLGIPNYPAEICIRQGRKFGRAQLETILQELLEMDAASKNGNLEATDACMMVIMKYAA
jgi:DNA polymerase-3 subunit delta